jgi:hypothetical protein
MAIRLIITAAIWLLPAGLAIAGHRMPQVAPLYPAGLALAAAVTAPVLADEMRARAGDRVYESCLAAIRDDRRAARRQAAVAPGRSAVRPVPPPTRTG